MVFKRAWMNFKRMEDMTVAASVLIYAAAVIQAFKLLPGGTGVVARWTLVWPVACLIVAAGVPLAIPVMRRWLMRWVWLSFRAGFGQTLFSVVSGIALLGGAAGFMYWQISTAVPGGRYPTGVFSAYAAGIGILIAQAVLVRSLERRPDVRALIEEG